MSQVIHCHAKTNLILRVGPRRSDGFHELWTVYQTLTLHDTVTLSLSRIPGVRIACDQAGVPVDERNLAWQAADRLLSAKGRRVGVDIRLEKRIPIGGGLGGGSANAAGVLMGLNRMLDPVLSEQELLAMARALGSDVPFFLVGGTALGMGRGEQVIPLPDAPVREGYLLVPPVSFSTMDMYDRLDRLPRSDDPLDRGLPEALFFSPEQVLENDFHRVVREVSGVVADRMEKLAFRGLPVILSGSGSTILVLGDTQRPVLDPDWIGDGWRVIGVSFACRQEVPHLFP